MTCFLGYLSQLSAPAQFISDARSSQDGASTFSRLPWMREIERSRSSGNFDSSSSASCSNPMWLKEVTSRNLPCLQMQQSFAKFMFYDCIIFQELNATFIPLSGANENLEEDEEVKFGYSEENTMPPWLKPVRLMSSNLFMTSILHFI